MRCPRITFHQRSWAIVLGVGEVDVVAVHWHTWQMRLYAPTRGQAEQPTASPPSRHLRRSIRDTTPLSQLELAVKMELDAGPARERMPRTDLECRAIGYGTTEPCPFVGCPNHLGVNVTKGGSLQVVYPHWEYGADESAPTCSLDEAERGEHTAREVGDLLGIGVNRVAQIEAQALRKLAKALGVDEWEVRAGLTRRMR